MAQPRLTKKLHFELVEEARKHAYFDGLKTGESKVYETLKQTKLELQLEQTKAVTALLQESSKMMSRAGYLLGKLNNQQGW